MKKNKKINQRGRAGITLIALVITIIVLLILAGISIQMLTGENSILSQAGRSRELTNQKQIEEKVRLAYNAALMGDMNNGHSKVQENTLNTELAKEFPGSTIEIDLKGEKWKVKIDNADPIEIEPGETSINETENNNQIKTAYLAATSAGGKTKGQITKEIQEDIDSTRNSILVTPCGKNTKITYVRTDNKYLMTPDGQIKKYEKTPVTEVWHKIDGTTIYFRNNKLNDSYSDSDIAVNTRKTITKAVFETEVVPNSVEGWFSNFRNLAEIEHLDYLDTSNATSFMAMFGYCQSLKTLDVSCFDTSNVEGLFGTFMNCYTLENLNVLNWDTSNVKDMGRIFCNCEKLKNPDFSDFDTHNAIIMETMFSGCKALTSLDLRTFDTSKVTSMVNMFRNCTNLKTIQVSSLWKTVEEDRGTMFTGCGTNKLTGEE